MKIILNFSLIIATLMLAHATLADIPPPPSPESLCQGLNEGAKCGNARSGSGTCLPVRGTLICIAVDDTAKAKDASPTDKAEIKDAAPGALGCTNTNMLPSSLLSLASLMMGLFIVMRCRKRI